ncbi:MAG: T9SS type A sorting domain-containing protein [Bacteroidetes bacterium]|nr:T9SS type A sorting domain-containing protein [Bacteroidota bacterium]
MKTRNILLYFLLPLLLITGNITIAQEEEEYLLENESSEEILAREEFILTRRAGGPEQVLSPIVYPNAIIQKSSMVKDRDITNNHTHNNIWISINPTGMFYQFTNNNYISGRTNSIAFHPTNPNIIYIAAAQGGVWKTTDGGINWISVTDNLSTLACGDIVIDKNNPNVLYLGTGELNYSGDSQYGNGIFKTTNGGASWTQVATVAQVGNKCSYMAIDPSNSDIVYMAGNNGLFKSTNAGANWTNTNAGTNVNCIIIDKNNTSVIYSTVGGTNSGAIRKSTDGGSTWTTLSGGLPTSMGRIQLAVAESNTDYIYASISNSSGALVGLYQSTNAGANWTSKATTPNYLSSQGWYDNSVTVKPTDPNFVVVGGLDVYVSTTGGSSLVQRSQWASTSSGNFCHADIHRLAYNGSVLYCCSDGGVYKSTNDGQNWTDLNRTISTLQFQSADYDPTNVLYLQGGTQDNNKETSTNGGTNWIQRSTGDGGYTIIDPVNTSYVYGQYVNGSIQRSNNRGTSFTNITPSGSSGGLFYNPYEMAPGDHNTIVFGRADIWKTTNAQTATTSSGWTQIATTSVVGGSVSAIGISSTNTGKIYIGTSNGRILVTTNNGANWSVSTGYQYVSDFVVDYADDDICYATFGGSGTLRVAKTTNGGVNWNNISANLPNIAINSAVLRTVPPRMLFVGTDLGVFQTTNEGVNWIDFNSGLPVCEIYDMKYKQNAGIVLAATHGRGCWTFDLNSILGIDPYGQIPEKYNLSQNFPNPFNPETNIEFDLPQYGMTRLEVYDISGKLIDKIVDQNLNAGHYRVQWRASKFASGTYVYRLQSGSYTATGKMVVVK